MTMLKLVSPSGEIMGAIVVPESVLIGPLKENHLHIYFIPPVPSFLSKEEMNSPIVFPRITIIPASAPRDAVMIVEGSLYDFEKIPGCFFIPGYDFIMKGRR